MRIISALLLCAAVQQAKPREIPDPERRRFIFLSVLEGCLEDGVPDKLVERILEQKNNQYVNFVYACPLCHPAIDAFRAFSMREQFYYGYKGDPYQVPCALPGELSDPKEMREGLEKLIQRWIGGRLNRCRLDEAERGAWKSAIERGRKEGMGMLLKIPPPPGMTRCPTCEGSFSGSTK